MSVKIYEAYRLKPKRDFEKFLLDVRARGVARVKRKLARFYTAALRDCINNPKALAGVVEVTKNPAFNPSEPSAFFTLVRWRELGCGVDPRRYGGENMFSVEVGLRMWMIRKRWYMMPSESNLCRGVLDFLWGHPDVEDYCYFDNSDKPKNVTANKWKRRARDWAPILDDENKELTVLRFHVASDYTQRYHGQTFYEPCYDKRYLARFRKMLQGPAMVAPEN